MTSKEEYIANISSGNFVLPTRKRSATEINLSKEEVIVSRLRKIKTGSVLVGHFKNQDTGEVLKIERFSGDKFKANTIVNKFKNFIEIVHYKQDFDCTLGRKELIYNQLGEKILRERPRAFIKKDGNLLPRDIVDWDKVAHSNTKSYHRSLDNFYGYIQSNTWKYFVTFTFSPKKVCNRLDDDQVKYAFKKFRQKLQYLNPDVKMIVVPQLHEKGGIHFHGFVGNVDLSRYLSLQRNKENKIVKSKCGEPLYDLSLFNFGFNSVAILPDDYDEKRIANYCIRYITRDERLGYAQKAYYRTMNLDFKDKVVTYYNPYDLFNLVDDLQVKLCKENKNMVVYRKYL